MYRMDEFTRKDLFNGMDKRSLRNAKKVKSPKYLGITDDYVVVMAVPSVTADPPTTYTVKIRLLDFPNLENEDDISTSEKLRLSLDGDVKISCTCPAFKYFGYEYITTELDSKEGDPQTIFPKIRNPKLEGTLCKHSYIAARYMGRLWKRISKDIDEMNFIR